MKRQKFMTKETEKWMKKYPLYSQDGKAENAVITAKYFFHNFTWYVMEWDSDDTFFGIVSNGGECEYGYFSAKEMQQVRDSWGLYVERDIYFRPQTVEEASKSGECYLKDFVENLKRLREVYGENVN